MNGEDFLLERLETGRLVLRPLASSDAPAIFHAYAQDSEVTRFLTWRPHRTLAETEGYVAARLAATTSRTYAIARRDDGDLIGAFDLRRTVSTRIEYGCVLARPMWGQGLMTEIVCAARDWALSQPGIWRFGAVVESGNHASMRVMEKAGLSREGLLRQWLVHPNQGDAPRDCFSYGVVRSAGAVA